MAIIGAHMLLFSPEADAVRAVFRDVFKFKTVDAGGGWLIFGLPPAELGIHPSEGTGAAAVQHTLSLICDDIHATVSELRARGIAVPGDPQDRGYGIVAMVMLPGGLEVQVYQPRHPLAIDVQAHG
jgi:hypothetical protein